MKSLALNAVLKINEKSGYSVLHAICINKDLYTATRIAVQAICAGHDIGEHRVRQRLGNKSKKAERFAGMSVIGILGHYDVDVCHMLDGLLRTLSHRGGYLCDATLEKLFFTSGDHSSSLLKAAATEDVDEVIRLVREGEDLNQRYFLGGCGLDHSSPLTVASMTGSHEILSTLIDLGAKVSPQRKRVIINMYRVPSPLSVASAWNNYNAVKLLIRNGADVNQIDVDDNTALHYAAANGNVEIVKLLLDSGARIDKNDMYGDSALHLTLVPAVRSELCFPPFEARYDHGPFSRSAPFSTKRRQTSKYLIERNFQVDKKNWWGQTPLYLALSSANTETVLLLTEKKSRGKGIPLGMSSDDEEEAIERGEEVKEEEREGKECKEGKREIKRGLLSLSTDTNVQVLRHLVDMKLLDVNTTDDLERTPLHGASQAGDMEAVGLLLRLCADINAVDKEGCTALHTAIKGSCPEIALKLIEGGANADVKDRTGRSSLHRAVMRGLKDIIDALLKHDVDINAVDKEGRTALHKADTAEIALKLIHEGAETNVRDNAGRLPLHEVAKKGLKEVMEPLLTRGVDINAVQ